MRQEALSRHRTAAFRIGLFCQLHQRTLQEWIAFRTSNDINIFEISPSETHAAGALSQTIDRQSMLHQRAI
jgi:hypothetical protein